MMTIVHLTAQCVVVGDFPMQDNGQISINITVDGLTSPNLNLGGQALCGVRVQFTHQLIGDVLLSLRSPSGDIVELTGPQVVTASTSLSVFDITFVPCGQVPVPDPGFNPQWDNNQPWAILGNYSGSYHPYNGCLEDFTGAANGLWTLIAQDAQGQDIGTITEVELIFCLPAGADCSECLAEGGALLADTIEQCANGLPVMMDLDPRYSDGPPNPSIYGYFYIVSKDGVVEDVTSNFNSNGLDTGLYTICGISVAHADSNVIKSFPSNLNYEQYTEFVLSTGICFDLSSTCAFLLVKGELPTFIRNQTICAGDTFAWRGGMYFETGNYTVRNIGANGCLRDHELNLTVLNPEAVIDVTTPFGCGVNVAELFGRDATYGSDVDFIWSSTDGTILTDPNFQNVEVSGTGTYRLITRRNFGASSFCDDTVSVTLVDDFIEPQVSYLGTVISCNVDSSLVRSITNISGSTIIWRDAFGVEDTVQNNVVYWGESFTLIAISMQGCRDSVDVVIAYDTISPNISVSNIDKTCSNDSVLISAGVMNPDWEYVWLTPSGNSVLSHEFRSDEIGTFTLTATADNGCASMNTITVNHLGTTPQFNIVADTFYCYTDSIRLLISSNLNESSFVITGPNNFSSMDRNVFIDRVGDYTITVETAEGCTYDTVWSPPIVDDVSSVVIEGDTLDCNRDTVRLRPIVNELGLTYSWSGPGNFMSAVKSPFVRENGNYEVVIRTKTGCRIDGSYNVVLDTLKPNVQVNIAGELNCLVDSIRFRVIEDEDNYLYNWTGPDNFQSNRKRPWAAEPGWYYTTVTKLNGCISFFSGEITEDFSVPTYDISATPITCDSSTSTVSLNTNASFVEWTRNSFQSNDTDLVLPSLGTYTLYLRGANGCDTTIMFAPPADTTHPDLVIQTDILGCDRDIVPLIVSSDLDISTVEWTNLDVADPDADSTTTQEPGIYPVLVTAENGCMSQASIEVIESFVIPDIDIGGTPSLNCERDTLFLHAVSSVDGLSYSWLLPDGSMSVDSSIVGFEGGDYQLAVEAPNSCKDTVVVNFIADTFPPDLNLFADSINCVNDQATLSAILSPDDQITWRFPDGTTNMMASFMTDQPGVYTATIFNSRSTCIDSSMIEVFVDTTTIDNRIAGQARLDCGRRLAKIYSLIQKEDAFLEWTGPGLSEQHVDTLFVSEPGKYYLRSTLPSLCFDLDSFMVVDDTIAPDLAIFGDTIKCDQPKVELSFVTSFNDVTYEWTGPQDFESSDSMPFVNVGGYYILELTNETNQCVTVDSILIVGDTLAPSVTVVTDFFSCLDTTSMAEAISMDSIDSYIWLGPDMFSATGREVLLDRTGEFVVVAFAPNGCVGRDTFVLDTFDLIDSVNLFADSITCVHPIATHRISHAEPNATVTWYESSTISSSVDSLVSAFGGSIQVVIENSRGCRFDSTFQVVIDTVSPQPNILPTGEIKCDNRIMELGLDFIGDPANMDFQWSTVNGQIISATDIETITIEEGGEFDLYMINLSNGCDGDASIEIVESLNTVLIENFSVQQPNCGNNYLASIEILNVSGASGQVTYSINESLETLDPLFSPLEAGDYVVYVTDDFGCQDSISATIDDVIIRFVDIERDTVLQLGVELFIESNDNFTEELIQSKIWTVNDEIICDGCDSLFFQPLISGYYTLSIIDTNGCVVSDSILIQIVSVPQMYVPNAFSPNGDGINDLIGPYFGKNIARVEDFSIYNRWGQKVHHRQDIGVEQDVLFWNGIDGLEVLQPGVFVYTLTVELIDGRIVNRKGEFHLIR